jgi:hypothetical protein
MDFQTELTKELENIINKYEGEKVLGEYSKGTYEATKMITDIVKKLTYQPSVVSKEEIEKKHLKLAKEVSDMIYNEFNPQEQKEFMCELENLMYHKYKHDCDILETQLNKVKGSLEVFIEGSALEKKL